MIQDRQNSHLNPIEMNPLNENGNYEDEPPQQQLVNRNSGRFATPSYRQKVSVSNVPNDSNGGSNTNNTDNKEVKKEWKIDIIKYPYIRQIINAAIVFLQIMSGVVIHGWFTFVTLIFAIIESISWVFFDISFTRGLSFVQPILSIVTIVVYIVGLVLEDNSVACKIMRIDQENQETWQMVVEIVVNAILIPVCIVSWITPGKVISIYWNNPKRISRIFKNMIVVMIFVGIVARINYKLTIISIILFYCGVFFSFFFGRPFYYCCKIFSILFTLIILCDAVIPPILTTLNCLELGDNFKKALDILRTIGFTDDIGNEKNMKQIFLHILVFSFYSAFCALLKWMKSSLGPCNCCGCCKKEKMKTENTSNENKNKKDINEKKNDENKKVIKNENDDEKKKELIKKQEKVRKIINYICLAFKLILSSLTYVSLAAIWILSWYYSNKIGIIGSAIASFLVVFNPRQAREVWPVCTAILAVCLVILSTFYYLNDLSLNTVKKEKEKYNTTVTNELNICCNDCQKFYENNFKINFTEILKGKQNPNKINDYNSYDDFMKQYYYPQLYHYDISYTSIENDYDDMNKINNEYNEGLHCGFWILFVLTIQMFINLLNDIIEVDLLFVVKCKYVFALFFKRWGISIACVILGICCINEKFNIELAFMLISIVIILTVQMCFKNNNTCLKIFSVILVILNAISIVIRVGIPYGYSAVKSINTNGKDYDDYTKPDIKMKDIDTVYYNEYKCESFLQMYRNTSLETVYIVNETKIDQFDDKLENGKSITNWLGIDEDKDSEGFIKAYWTQIVSWIAISLIVCRSFQIPKKLKKIYDKIVCFDKFFKHKFKEIDKELEKKEKRNKETEEQINEIEKNQGIEIDISDPNAPNFDDKYKNYVDERFGTGRDFVLNRTFQKYYEIVMRILYFMMPHITLIVCCYNIFEPLSYTEEGTKTFNILHCCLVIPLILILGTSKKGFHRVRIMLFIISAIIMLIVYVFNVPFVDNFISKNMDADLKKYLSNIFGLKTCSDSDYLYSYTDIVNSKDVIKTRCETIKDNILTESYIPNTYILFGHFILMYMMLSINETIQQWGEENKKHHEGENYTLFKYDIMETIKEESWNKFKRFLSHFFEFYGIYVIQFVIICCSYFHSYDILGIILLVYEILLQKSESKGWENKTKRILHRCMLWILVALYIYNIVAMIPFFEEYHHENSSESEADIGDQFKWDPDHTTMKYVLFYPINKGTEYVVAKIFDVLLIYLLKRYIYWSKDEEKEKNKTVLLLGEKLNRNGNVFDRGLCFIFEHIDNITMFVTVAFFLNRQDFIGLIFFIVFIIKTIINLVNDKKGNTNKYLSIEHWSIFKHIICIMLFLQNVTIFWKFLFKLEGKWVEIIKWILTLLGAFDQNDVDFVSMFVIYVVIWFHISIKEEFVKNYNDKETDNSYDNKKEMFNKISKLIDLDTYDRLIELEHDYNMSIERKLRLNELKQLKLKNLEIIREEEMRKGVNSDLLEIIEKMQKEIETLQTQIMENENGTNKEHMKQEKRTGKNQKKQKIQDLPKHLHIKNKSMEDKEDFINENQTGIKSKIPKKFFRIVRSIKNTFYIFVDKIIDTLQHDNIVMRLGLNNGATSEEIEKKFNEKIDPRKKIIEGDFDFNSSPIENQKENNENENHIQFIETIEIKYNNYEKKRTYELFRGIGCYLSEHTEVIVAIGFVLNYLFNRNIISTLYPICALSIILVSSRPNPKKLTLIVISVFILLHIAVRYLFQFPGWCIKINDNQNQHIISISYNQRHVYDSLIYCEKVSQTSQNFQVLYLFGIYPGHIYLLTEMVWDIVCLMLLFMHIHHMESSQYWHNYYLIKKAFAESIIKSYRNYLFIDANEKGDNRNHCRVSVIRDIFERNNNDYDNDNEQKTPIFKEKVLLTVLEIYENGEIKVKNENNDEIKIIDTENVVYRNIFKKEQSNEDKIFELQIGKKVKRIKISDKNKIGRFTLYLSKLITKMGKPGKDYFPFQLGCEVLCLLYLIVFSPLFVETDGTFIDYFQTDYDIPFSYSLNILLQGLFIVFDYIVFVRKSVGGKTVLQFVSIISFHLLIALYYPITDEKNGIFASISLAIFYIFKVVYWFISAYQIRDGYETISTYNIFRSEYTSLHSKALDWWYKVPLVYELKTLIKWTFTKTSLSYQTWLKIEDIQFNLFMKQCENVKRWREKEDAKKKNNPPQEENKNEEMKQIEENNQKEQNQQEDHQQEQMKKQNEKEESKPKQKMKKVSLKTKLKDGMLKIVIFIIILFVPLLLVSNVMPLYFIPKPTSITIEINIRNYGQMYAQYSVNSTELDKNELKQVKEKFNNFTDLIYDLKDIKNIDDLNKLKGLKDFLPGNKGVGIRLDGTMGIFKMKIPFNSLYSWNIPFNSQVDLYERFIEHDEPLTLDVKITITRENSVAANTFTSEYPFDLDHKQKETLIYGALQLDYTYMETKLPLFPQYFLLPRMNENSLRELKKEKYCIKAYPFLFYDIYSLSQYWHFYDVNETNTGDNYLTENYIYIVSPEVAKGDLNDIPFMDGKFSEMGIVAIYTVAVMFIYNYFKTEYVGISNVSGGSVVIETMKDCSSLLLLCDDISLARQEEDFDLENESANLLLDIYNSPALLFHMTEEDDENE